MYNKTVQEPKKWEDNINMDIREVSCEDGSEMEPAWDCIQFRLWTFSLLPAYCFG